MNASLSAEFDPTPREVVGCVNVLNNAVTNHTVQNLKNKILAVRLNSQTAVGLQVISRALYKLSAH